jgi:hypothetical protein
MWTPPMYNCDAHIKQDVSKGPQWFLLVILPKGKYLLFSFYVWYQNLVCSRHFSLYKTP